MANFVQADIEALGAEVATKVLATVEPQLVALANEIATKLIAEVGALIEAKLTAALGGGQA